MNHLPSPPHPSSIPDDDVPRINLMGAGDNRSGAEVPRPAPVAAHQAGVGMSMEQLEANYGAILDARAIHYPVAYRFLGDLGRGRQGRVFLGLRQGARGCFTEHAIKVFDPSIYRSPEEYWTDMGRIAVQISKLQRVHSPYLVTRHSYEETYGIGYVEMEAIDGVDLRRLLDGTHLRIACERSSHDEQARFGSDLFRCTQEGHMQFQPGLVVYVLRGVLRGVERLHEMGFLHSDVKPGNVMIDRLGYVRVVDFGRAVLSGEKLSFLLGSPLYMAPEIHRREAGGAAADLYSVGVMGLEMLRGERLATMDTHEDELLQLKMSLPERLEELLPADVRENESLVGILRRLLEPDPVQRLGSAKEAETVDSGLGSVEKQLVQADLDAEHDRGLADYLAKFVDPAVDRVIMPGPAGEESS